MEPTETSPLLIPRESEALRKTSIVGSVKSAIEGLIDNERERGDEEAGSQKNAGPKPPPYNLLATIPLLLFGMIIPSVSLGSVYVVHFRDINLWLLIWH